VGCLLVAEAKLAGPTGDVLCDLVARQPPWSDVPIVVLTDEAGETAASAALERLGSVILLDRSVRTATLTSAIRAALRARERQYEVRQRLDAQDLFTSIVASSDDAIISKTLNGEIRSWNSGAERIFGYPAAEAIGQSITLIIPPDRLAEEQMILERLRRGERIDHYETVRMTKDGRRLDISLTISPVRDATGRIVGASKVARDISEQKHAEQALRDADRRKDEFLATLAHELRNPLAPIRNSLHVLRLAGYSDPTLERVCGMLERQVDHMVRLVDDLLEVSRITRGLVELRREPVELAQVVRSALEASQPAIDTGRHRLSLTLPPEPLVVHADPVRLSQVLTNLLNNAAKYTPDAGDIWLVAGREGNTAVISVHDTGIGIPKEMLPHVFEVFIQGDGASRRAQSGLGIGLTLVRSLVEMHGGTVTAASEGAGKGSRFVVRLPLADAALGEPQAEPEIAPIAALRVLVVDDNRDAADSLSVLLEFLGAEARVVYDGDAALQAFEASRPDLVLLDLGMPGMDGYQVARRIREHRDVPQPTLVALTGWGQEEDRRRTRSAGFDQHLLKPIGIHTLQALLASITARQSNEPRG
jgi:PAS domain S-box-containing protein